MEAADYSGGGDKGDIDSVAPTTALAADQVKEGGRAPTDCSRKRKNREKKEMGDGERLRHRKRKGVIKVHRQQRFHLANNKPTAFATNSILPLMYTAFS